MNILHISDIHFRLSYEQHDRGYEGMISKMDNPLIQLKTSLEHAKLNHSIDLLLISGDLTEDGTKEDYTFLKAWLKKELPDTQVIVTLGNHDIKKNFREGWLEIEGTGEYYNEVFEFDEFCLITFDSSVYGEADGHMSDNQFLWLEEQLSNYQTKPIFLMTHHHLFETQSSTLPLPQSNKLLNVISRYKVNCFLNGHTHHVYTRDIKGIQYFTAGGMSFVGEDEGEGIVRFDQRFGYNFYQVNKGVITHQTTENFVIGKVIDRVNMRE